LHNYDDFKKEVCLLGFNSSKTTKKRSRSEKRGGREGCRKKKKFQAV